MVVTRETAKGGGGNDDDDERRHVLTVFDVQNKFVAFAAPLARPTKWILSEWGLLFAVSDDGDCRYSKVGTKTHIAIRNLAHFVLYLLLG